MTDIRSAPHRAIRSWLVCLLLPLVLALSHPEAAFPAQAAPVEQSKSPAKPALTSAEAQALLDKAQQGLAAVEATPDFSAGAPSGTNPEELTQRIRLLREETRARKRLLVHLARLDTLARQLEETRRKADTWGGMESPPPWTVPFLDRLLREQAAQRSNLEIAQGRHALIEKIVRELNDELPALASASRQADERVNSAGATPPPEAVWGREMAHARLRAQTAQLDATRAASEVVELETAIARQEFRMAERRVEAVRGQAVFPEEAFNAILKGLDDQRLAIAAILNRALEAEAAAVAETARAQQALDRAVAEAQGAAEAEAALAPLRQALGGARQRDRAAEALVEALRLQPLFVAATRAAWEYRYRLAQGRSPALIAEVRERRGAELQRLQLMTNSLRTRLEQLERAAGQSPEGAAAAPVAEARKALALADEAEGAWARLAEEAGTSAAEPRLTEQLSAAWLQGTHLFLRLWNFELFTVEQTVEVDGKPVTGSSSITVGKIARAIVLFVLGVWLARWVGLAGERLVIRRLNYDPMRARILRKWLFALGVIVLVVAVLGWVNIPLTVFAFLGGAIAIGVGFGMQNLLKNLISGLMLLFERPFQPGDLIEVGALKGTVREIGIRSSVIRDANGVDTLVPNSTFVEGNVTNWVHDTPKVRAAIRVGVAYGSPVKEVVALLAECAERHKLALADPPPQVLLENFGADALEFELLYWIEISSKSNGRQIASDLRFMIEKGFRGHGIAMPFPQREVHLSAAGPLRVELASAAAVGNGFPDPG